ncbi:MAG TPA: DsrE family protein [Beijerinckiaceae bacterium]|nr:DsrE family protein [Beijerinckiaceae bacterium]
MSNMMSKRGLLALGAALFVAPAAFAQQGGGAKPSLFINMTSDDSHRLTMGLGFGLNQLKRGHSVTVFLNDRAVHAASKKNAEKFTEQQKIIADLLGAGATVLVCPMCSKHYGVAEADFLPGLKLGNPELTGGALFADNARSLTW